MKVDLDDDKVQELKAIEKNIKVKVNDAPPGYYEIELSTKGKIGAPQSVLAKNFGASEILTLSTLENEDLPEKVASILQGLIWNPNNDIDVLDWDERELIELLVKMYKMFFGSAFTGITWEMQESDWDFIEEKEGKQKMLDKKNAYINERWKPTFDIDLTNLSYHEVPSNFKAEYTVTSKKRGFSVTFGYPKFGDVLAIKKFIEKAFEVQDKRWAKTKEVLQYKQNAIREFASGKDINLARIPDITEHDKKAFKEYETDKIDFAIQVTKALYVREFDGQDLRNSSLAERVELVKDDVRFDFGMTKAIDKANEQLKIGINDELNVENPITFKTETRRLPFQLYTILQAIGNDDSDDYTISTD